MSLKRSSGQAENQFQKGYVFGRESKMLWLISFNLGLKLPHGISQSNEKLIKVKTVTFSEVDVGRSVHGSVLRGKVIFEFPDRALGWSDKVNRLHGRQRLALLLNRFHD